MAIIIKQGNILNAVENIIGHQVNGIGVMGSGLAKQIRNQYPHVYRAYREFTLKADKPEQLLGINLMLYPSGRRLHNDEHPHKGIKIFANLFGQARISRHKKMTDEQALRQALEQLAAYAKEYNLSVALPYGIGCGLGGGDWNVVYDIIDDVFQDHSVTLYRYNGEDKP